MEGVDLTLDHLFRQESGRIIAGLIRIAGSFDLAEEALQDAFTTALTSWGAKGIPSNPAAWITTTAQHKLIDLLRRQRTKREKSDMLAAAVVDLQALDVGPRDSQEMEDVDDRLRLIFTCCHPALNVEARVALSLRTLGGLTTTEIARAFLIPEATLAQRLVRAKRKIQEARIPYEVPGKDRLPERLSAVQAVIYLIFNEGYASTDGTELVRGDLCREAIRLGRMLCELLPQDCESKGLLALMLFADSRRTTRVAGGELVTLEEQDRSRWDHDAISEGLRLMDSVAMQGTTGPYQLQGAIASMHARAANARETDWAQIAQFYRKLMELHPSPVIALNEAVAVAMSSSLEAGLAGIDEIERSGSLDRYFLLHAARADLLRRLGRDAEACSAYRTAIDMAENPLEIRYLTRRLQSLQSSEALDKHD